MSLFRYADLPEHSFRLLSFEANPATHGSIKCKIENHSLASEPDYDALSYTWNAEKPTKTIICNGQHLLVTPSVCEALFIFQQLRHERLIWIDGICIDQSDRHDKERQVPLMGTYYSNAASVIVWLGPSGSFTDLVFESIDQLLDAFEGIEGHILASESVLRSHSLAAPKDNIWQGIGDIYSRPWFQRLWIVQEVALAQQTLVYCGLRATEWRQLANLASGVCRAGLTNLARAFENVDPSRTDGFSGAMFPDFVAEYRRKHKTYPLHSALHFARSRQTSEPVDKVYAVLGLVDNDARDQVPVDYSEEARKEFWNVYVNAVAVALRTGSGLGWLLMEASSQEALQGLPSWCPNFNSTLKCFALPYQFFNAGGGSLGASPEGSNCSISDDKKRLSLQAYQIDSVMETIPGTWQWHVEPALQGGPDGCAARDWAWMNSCLELARKTLGQRNISPEALVRTLIADVLHEPPTPSPEVRSLFKSVFPATVYLQALRNLPHLAHKAVSDEEKILLQRYLNAMNLVCGGRSFFATTGGRFGIGPAEIREGDLVCVLRSGRVPFVFRAVLEQDGLYELVGEAYVHDVMKGEIFEREEQIVKYFTLV
ncbi:MAG: hypothetical protein Q9170_002887 [Blastenia crenularia]